MRHTGRIRRRTASRDNVFADGSDHELAALSGDTTAGYTTALTVGVAV